MSNRAPSILLAPRDQFFRRGPDRHRHPRGRQFVLAVLGIATCLALARWGTQLENVTGVLAAVSIVTGLCFSMATTVWNKSIDARATAPTATDGYALTVLDDTRNHLVFTVMVGVCLAGLSVLYQVLLPGQSVPPAPPLWLRAMSSMIAGGSIYLFILVLQALAYFQQVFYVLKR